MVKCPHPECKGSHKEFLSESTMRQHHTKIHDERLPNCTCKYCGKEFFHKSGRRKYCTEHKDKCYESESTKIETAVCTDCGEDFSYYPSSTSGKFCSECWKSKQTKNRNKGVDDSEIEVICDHCVEDTGENLIQDGNLRYCSEECRDTEYNLSSGIENTNDKGSVSESKVIESINQRGYDVSIPFKDDCRYDLVLDVKDKLLRVQVKTGCDTDKGTIEFRTSSVKMESKNSQVSENYQGDADVFAVYSPSIGRILWIPVEEAPDTRMFVRYNEPKHRLAKINYLEQYTFNRGIGRTMRYIQE